ncbi:gluconate 2-dehydrogenase subunit 3 family protein [Bryobacter aggregatus]|uniref:gluconate 2-dehydrogenase subunit 3 family protein n=1 Tax=Bryobacter aggregatus TaxID=360054 RepID=UPI0004E145A0|nr:gluconate 2-dehydrogenase subunit 3 family protein [Bryobacter aggregatus]
MPENAYGDGRRETIKIIGTIGLQCAFPFAGDELYGQHQHPAPANTADAGPPQFFRPEQFQVLSRVAELIVPGATAARVPNYIDLVVRNNAEHQKLYTDGLAWLAGKDFLKLGEKQQLAILEPLCAQVDRGEVKTMEQRFFRVAKNMTADGYYTSKAGLVEELGYLGNQVLAEYPECKIDEH